MIKRILSTAALALTVGVLTVSAASAAVFDVRRIADDNSYTPYYGERGFGQRDMTVGTALTLPFHKKVVIDAITFRKSGRPIWESSDAGFFNRQIDSGGYNATSFAPFPAMLMGQMLGFAHPAQQHKDRRFYMDSVSVSDIPLPPALLLFGAALGGIGFLGRRQKAKTALVA
ncbi:MAG: hypothetical protein COB93_07760 [Sneathiella sp.]|nr:MAG: hypothetical protein COB93_07760 [Sneathiella sp.]